MGKITKGQLRRLMEEPKCGDIGFVDPFTATTREELKNMLLREFCERAISIMDEHDKIAQTIPDQPEECEFVRMAVPITLIVEHDDSKSSGKGGSDDGLVFFRAMCAGNGGTRKW
ncbi:MAG: hypothetical protein AAFS13_02145 [Pseudomonadota bacterium]